MKNIKILVSVVINSMIIVSGAASVAVGIEGVRFQIAHQMIDWSTLLIATFAITGMYCIVKAGKTICRIFESKEPC